MRGRQARRSWRSGAVAASLLVTAGCTAGAPALTVSAAQGAVPVSGSSQVAVSITNLGDGDDELIGARTPAALGVEIHVTEISNQRATMRQLDRVAIPAGNTIQFRPGGLHLMLVIPDPTMVAGTTFDLTFEFARSDEITVEVSVVELLDLVEQDRAASPSQAQ